MVETTISIELLVGRYSSEPCVGGREDGITTARTKAATTSASFGTRILTQCIPGLVSGGCAESKRYATGCGLKTRGLRSTLKLEAGKFYRLPTSKCFASLLFSVHILWHIACSLHILH